MRIFINAGHYDKDSGASDHGYVENLLTMAVRDVLKSILTDRDCFYVPDNLNLRKSIDLINETATNEDFAIEIHFNQNADRKIRGTEAYFFKDNKFAKIFSREVSIMLGIPNRGPMPDSQSYFGELGWLRQLKCPSVLVEGCYLSNVDDINALHTEKIARGIKKAIDVLFPIAVADQSVFVKKIAELQAVILALIKQIVELLKYKK